MLKWTGRILFLLLLAFLSVIASQCHRDIPFEQLREKYGLPPSRFVEVEGMDVHYRDEGKGPVLVLLHGTGSSLHTWEGWRQELGEDFRIIRMDLPGFGLTGPFPERGYSIGAYVDFLDAFLSQINIDTCYLAGNSLGGLIAWEYALDHPERVRKLILIDPAGYPRAEGTAPPLAIRLAQTPLLSLSARWITPKSLARKSLLEVYYDDSKVTQELVDRYFDLLLRSGNRQAFIDRAAQRSPSRIDQLSGIQMPTLIQWGTEDIWIPVENAHRFASKLPQAQVILYENAGHVPMEEIPGTTATDARRFLTPSSNNLN